MDVLSSPMRVLLLLAPLVFFAACAAPVVTPRLPTPLPTFGYPPVLTDQPSVDSAASCSRSSSYITCEGFVTNLTTSSLSNVQVVIVFEVDGNPVASDTSFITYDPLLPGQQSPWKVITRDNPAFTTRTVEFKLFAGPKLRVRYDY